MGKQSARNRTDLAKLNRLITHNDYFNNISQPNVVFLTYFYLRSILLQSLTIWAIIVEGMRSFIKIPKVVDSTRYRDFVL